MAPALCQRVTTAQAQSSVRIARPFLSVGISRRQVARWQTRAVEPETTRGAEIENPDSESARRAAKVEQLRAAEKFMVVGSGEATCKNCGFEYKPERGDPDFPVAKGTKFQDTPADYQCPTCGSPKDQFDSRLTVVAGFAENQRYGLGTNSMTEAQKSLIIYGSLALFFVLFLAGYAMD